MAGTIYSGNYTSAISLTNPATQRPVTVTGTIDVANTGAMFGDPVFAWTVNNDGTIEGTGSAGSGIQLANGGTVNNLVAGSVSPGGVSGAALIAGYKWGILINGAPGSVTNLGQIEATGANSPGIDLTAGGSVSNGSVSDTTALISGGWHSIAIYGAAGVVTNFGTITSASSHTDVFLFAGGAVTNGSKTSTQAEIDSTGGGTAVYANYGAGNVTNFGSIIGGRGVLLLVGGIVTNGQSGSTAGLISGTSINAVTIAGTTGTVVNFGKIENSNNTAAVIAVTAGGTVTNGAPKATSALITGSGTGVYINNGLGTVTNFGRILATSALSGAGVVLEKGGIVTNFGTVQNADTSVAGVYLRGNGVVINGKTGASIGTISGAETGVSIRGGAGTVTNAGTILGSTNNGIYLNGGGSVINQAGGVIAGRNEGVYNRGVAVTITNSGMIKTTGTADGIHLRGGGTVINNAGATIIGSAAGVAIGEQGGAVTNRGFIEGVIGFYGETHHSGNITLNNYGTVASTAGATGIAVEIGNGTGNNLLIVEKGAVFTGLVEGGGRGEIEFAATGTAPMTGNISGFETVALANGGADSLTLTNANFNGVASGRITVIGGNDGNTVNAGSVSRSIMMIGGAGKDVFTGGSGQIIFEFSASTLTSADKVTGGGGYDDELLMTGAGTVAASGVSEVEIYQLANGAANTLDLVNANFTGLPSGAEISVYGGNDGNTISAAAVTVKTVDLIIYGGAGTDALTGSAGNTVFEFAAGDLTNSDTITGRSGNDTLLMTSAGTVSAGGVTGVESYVLADGSPNTLNLTGANFTKVTGSAITISDGNNGNTVSLAAVAPSADHIIVYAGGGKDTLTGAAGNDVFYAGGDTTMTGKGGANQFVFGAAGNNTIADFGVSTTNEMLFLSGSGFSLPGATATPKALGGLFVEDSSGSFTSAAQRFAYDTANGDLYYSATGSTATRHLVVALTGEPALNPAHLLFAT